MNLIRMEASGDTVVLYRITFIIIKHTKAHVIMIAN